MLLRDIIDYGRAEGFISKEVAMAAVLFKRLNRSCVGAALAGIFSCFALKNMYCAL